ncbi:MAG: hypothetical protein JWM25_1485, partial [Thermoleophilia bacterium]|nr:hypothetical protein [Thermoleophilia bacterium]
SGVYKMLVDAGVNPSTALILASDDGISGAGRLNGMNEQDGSRDGFNAGERATWAFAAQLQAQGGLPIIMHMMHGHDHAGIDASALTKPKVNGLIGMAADDRSASDARAAALFAALQDGRVATPATAAADQNLTVRNQSFLKPATALRVDVDSMDWEQAVGTVRTTKVRVKNDGPHVALDVALTLATSRNLQLVSIGAPTGSTCSGAACSVGDVSAETDREKVFTVTVKFVGGGRTSLTASLTTSSPVTGSNMVRQKENSARIASKGTVGMTTTARSFRYAACGFSPVRQACVTKRAFGTSFLAIVNPARQDARSSRRTVEVVYQQRVGKMWRTRHTTKASVDVAGRARVRTAKNQLARGVWRVQVKASSHGSLLGTTSAHRYFAVR